jgi:hypothetical protein
MRWRVSSPPGAVWDLSGSHLGICKGVAAIGDFLVGYWTTLARVGRSRNGAPRSAWRSCQNLAMAYCALATMGSLLLPIHGLAVTVPCGKHRR